MLSTTYTHGNAMTCPQWCLWIPHSDVVYNSMVMLSAISPSGVVYNSSTVMLSVILLHCDVVHDSPTVVLSMTHAQWCCLCLTHSDFVTHPQWCCQSPAQWCCLWLSPNGVVHESSTVTLWLAHSDVVNNSPTFVCDTPCPFPQWCCLWLAHSDVMTMTHPQ